MDQIKIGRFIAERRKKANLTQAQLAEKLGITDRAVSKWETGRSLPDASLMLDLCGLLGINVNDLLSGEVVTVENYDEKIEKTIIELAKEKERADKRLLTLEIVLGLTATLFFLTLVLIASVVEMQDWQRIALIVFGAVVFIVAVLFCIRIEQVAGYYECGKCGHRYIPGFGVMIFAMHMGRTRYMKCPKCGKRSWQKKVIGK